MVVNSIPENSKTVPANAVDNPANAVDKLNATAVDFEQRELSVVLNDVGALARGLVQSQGGVSRIGFKDVAGGAGHGQLEGLQGEVDLMTSVRLIQGARARGFPHSMSEEHGLSYREKIKMALGWLFDPVDGTWEHRNGIEGGYGILSAFLRRDGTGRLNPTHGIIAIPRPNETELFYNTWSCVLGDGGVQVEQYKAHYQVNGEARPLPHIRTLGEIKSSGVLRVHIRGVFADMADSPEKDFGVKHDVAHVALVRQYCQGLAAKLGVTYEEVKAGGSGSGSAQLLGGKVDLVVTLGRNNANDRGDAASEWDVAAAVPNVRARGGWVCQSDGSDMSVRGFMQDNPLLAAGWVASVALPKGVVFDGDLNPGALWGKDNPEIPHDKRGAVEAFLDQHGQGHLNAGLTPELAERVRGVRWNELMAPPPQIPWSIETAAEPSKLIVAGTDTNWQRYEELGRQLYREGKVGVVLVAGGKGTRLGFDQPKGCHPFAGGSIFKWHIEQAQAVGNLYGFEMPVGIMTSPATHADTEQFFKAQAHFGRSPSAHHLFSQGTIPSLDLQGKAVLEAKGRLLENPDGHGGFLRAVNQPDVARFFSDRGVEYVVYVQVDNVGAEMDIPGFVGYLADQNLDVVTGVVRPNYQNEKLGRLMSVQDSSGARRDVVIEYSDLSEAALEKLGSAAAGGNISYYVWRLGDKGIGRYADYQLPLYSQQKDAIGWFNGAHRPVTVRSQEGRIHDVFGAPGIGVGAVLVDNRDGIFWPIKDADGKPGVVDTPSKAFQLACSRSMSWLQAAGYPVSSEQRYVVTPEVAHSAEVLKSRVRNLIERLGEDGTIYFTLSE